MSDSEKIQRIAEKTLAVMQENKVAPSPENYQVWFNYVAAENKELVSEIEKIRAQKVAFTPQVAEYLHDKYLVSHEARDKDAQDTSAMLSQVLQMINKFKGETDSYNEKLGEQTDKLSASAADGASSELLEEIVGQLREIRETGANFTAQLEESRKEAEQLRQTLQQVKNESQHDFLTGVYNRRALDEFLIECTQDAEANIKDLCLLMIDIDHFKPFNDKWGHQIGDEVLKTVAKALTKCVRGSDIVARYGGEEFSVLLRETPVTGAKIVAENIRKSIAGSRLKRKDSGSELDKITVSIGIAVYHVGEEDTVPYLIKRADDALYEAKKAGRNRVIVAKHLVSV